MANLGKVGVYDEIVYAKSNGKIDKTMSKVNRTNIRLPESVADSNNKDTCYTGKEYVLKVRETTDLMNELEKKETTGKKARKQQIEETNA